MGVNLAFLVLAALYNASFLRDAIRGAAHLDIKPDDVEQESIPPDDDMDPETNKDGDSM